MKVFTKISVVVSVLLIGLASCSKEKRVENQLTKKDGKWDVNSVEYRYYLGGSVQESATYPATGSMQFKKNGSFFMNIVIGAGFSLTSSGTWTNTEDQINLLSNGQASIIEIKEGPKKDKLVLVENYLYPETDEKESFTYIMERAD
jgi:hypothetical protein